MFLFRMLHRFSIGCKSGEQAGHCMFFPCLAKTLFKYSVVVLPCVTMHENRVFLGMPTSFVPWDEVLLQEVHVDFGSHFNSI